MIAITTNSSMSVNAVRREKGEREAWGVHGNRAGRPGARGTLRRRPFQRVIFLPGATTASRECGWRQESRSAERCCRSGICAPPTRSLNITPPRHPEKAGTRLPHPDFWTGGSFSCRFGFIDPLGDPVRCPHLASSVEKRELRCPVQMKPRALGSVGSRSIRSRSGDLPRGAWLSGTGRTQSAFPGISPGRSIRIPSGTSVFPAEPRSPGPDIPAVGDRIPARPRLQHNHRAGNGHRVDRG